MQSGNYESINLSAFDVHIVSAASDLSKLPTASPNLVVLARVGNEHVFHLRIFDADGKKVIDADAAALVKQGIEVGGLTSLIADKWESPALTELEKLGLISAVASATGYLKRRAVRKLVVDNVHGDIAPSDLEWKIIDTPAFQRLRKLKQLQMGYLVYPNATHTRFAHSLGVLKVMQRILENVRASNRDKEDLCLAALMHDIGHFPYSHLLEGVDKVVLTEERLDTKPKAALTDKSPYPKHEDVGREILLNQRDLLHVLGSEERAERIGHLFTRSEVADQQLSKLIHSSLDMDRLDYLIRDSRATGVPYGIVDIHYLLNHVKQSPAGTIGITHKAVAAAEHLLLARSFLFRVVCQHKTIFGFEEVARQLLRRLRDRAQSSDQRLSAYGVPADGDAVMQLVRGPELYSFTDAFLDDVFVSASKDAEPIVRILASTIISRKPPRVLLETRTFEKRSAGNVQYKLFESLCRLHLKDLADSHSLEPGQFLISELKEIGFESRAGEVSMADAQKEIDAGERTEMIMVFESPEVAEPIPIVDLKHSILNDIGSHVFRTHRLYFVAADEKQEQLVSKLRKTVKQWN